MIQIFPLETRLSDLEVFWESIGQLWTEQGGTHDIVPLLQARAIQSTAGIKTLGLIAYSNQQPVSVGWVEKSTPYYGNVFLFSLSPHFRSILPAALIKAGYLEGVYLELIQFENAPEYREAFLAAGIREFERQRMGMELVNYTPTCPPIEGASVSPLTLDDAPIVGPISALAHLIGQDYPGYCELEDPEHRIALEAKVFAGLYGKVVPQGSLKLHYNDQVVGSCLIVSIECWGYSEVPWVFDISIHPDFQGKGLGRYLMEASMTALKETGYAVMGLAVTVGNGAAIHLYQSLGLILVEPFYEFTYKSPNKKELS